MTSGHAIREAKAHSDTFKKLFTDILLLSVSFRKNTDNVHWFTSQLTDMQEWSISDVSSPNELGKERSNTSHQKQIAFYSKLDKQKE